MLTRDQDGATDLVSEASPVPRGKAPSLSGDFRSQPELTQAAIAIVTHLRARAAGANDGPWQQWRRFACTQDDWTALHAYISSLGPRDGQTKEEVQDRLWGYFYDKVRLDSFCYKGFAVVRMSFSPQHEMFRTCVEAYILESVAAIKRRGGLGTGDGGGLAAGDDGGATPAEDVPEDARSAALYADRIRPHGSTKFPYMMSAAIQGTHSPDGSFGVLPPEGGRGMPIPAGVPIPGLIIEVSYSQKRKDLPKLADHYLLGTAGDDVQLVLCFDFGYRGGNDARVISYRRRVEQENGRQVISVEQALVQDFASTTGELIPGEVAFLLSDFGPRLHVPAEHQRIVLDFRRLHRFFFPPSQVEKSKAIEDLRVLWQSNAAIRARESSSPEDETPLLVKFDREVERAEKKARRDDPDWNPSQTSCLLQENSFPARLLSSCPTSAAGSASRPSISASFSTSGAFTASSSYNRGSRKSRRSKTHLYRSHLTRYAHVRGKD